MINFLRVAVALRCPLVPLPGQTVTQSARALTDLTVSTLTEIHGSTVVVPAGAPLATGTLAATQPSLFGDACLLSCILAPTPTGQRYRLTWLSGNFMANSMNTGVGDRLLNLKTAPAAATAVRLLCSYVGATDGFLTQQLRGEIDVQADGSLELVGLGPTTVTQTVPAVVTPSGLPVRTSIQAMTWSSSRYHSLRLEVAVEE